MIRTALAATLAAGLACGAPARSADPADYGALVDRYATACTAISASECEIGLPVSAEDAGRLSCLFAELEARAGAGTAAAHVAWAEGFAATGQPPATGFPATIGQQQILVAAMIACGDPQTP